MVPPIRRYFVADLTPRGDVRATEEYRYEQLEQIPGAMTLIAHFAAHIWREPEEFQTTVPLSQTPTTLRWRATSDSTGICTVRIEDQLASLSLLASGLEPQADQIVLGAFQQHLLRELHGTEFEPSFAMLEIRERPLVATVSFHAPATSAEQFVLALVDRCFAAAYFRYKNLA
jgi:hypothetical protein